MTDPVSALAALGTAAGASSGAAVATGAAITSLGVGAVGAGLQYNAQSDAAEAAQAARRQQAKRQNVQALREAQIKRAMLTQQAANTGTTDSSGFSGGTSSLQSQLASNVGFANQMSVAQQNIQDFQQQSQRIGAVTGLVQSGLNLAGQMQPSQPTQVDAQGTNSLYNQLYGG